MPLKSSTKTIEKNVRFVLHLNNFFHFCKTNLIQKKMKKVLATLSLAALSTGAFAVNGTIFGNHVCHSQGPNRLGGPVSPTRSVFTRVNGEPQRSDIPVAEPMFNAYSLGSQGFVVLMFDVPVAPNPAGADFRLWETTYEPMALNANSEQAEVYISQDGSNFVSLGMKFRDSDWELPAGWDYVSYVKVVDRTNPDPSASNTDGDDFFDVDGVEGFVVYNPRALPPCGIMQGTCKDGSPIHPLRSNPAKMNVAEMNDGTGQLNFFSLGFHGYACFNMGRQVFDEPGAEVAVYETTWMNQPCPNYPETVRVYASADGGAWTDLGPLCKDGLVDFNGAIANAQYLKLVDITDESLFDPKADGYDIDGIVVRPPTQGSPCGSNRRAVSFDQKFNDDSNIPESMPTLTVLGNPVGSSLKVSFTVGEENLNFIVRNHMGQEVSRMNYKGNLFSVDEVSIPMDNVAAGVYFITLEAGSYKEVAKFVKN